MSSVVIFYIIFLDFLKRKLGPIKKNLRHSSLDQNAGYMYRKFQISIYYSKRDNKSENGIFFYFSALLHIIPFIYFYNICINVYGF